MEAYCRKFFYLGGSKDEDGHVVEWKWVQVDGPINPNLKDLRPTATLEIDKLLPGNYTFK